jgi:hypothetical protein
LAPLATKVSLFIGLGVAVTLVGGCGRAPESLAQQAARATPQPAEIFPEPTGRSTPAEPESTPTAAAEAVATPVVQFKNPQTQAAVADYQSKWQQLQDDRESGENLGAIDPLVNPQAISDYAGMIGTHANQLDQAERAAKGLMDPNEKKRFKQLQKQLTEEQEEQ